MVVKIFLSISIDIDGDSIAFCAPKGVLDNYSLLTQLSILSLLLIRQLASFRLFMGNLNIVVFFFEALKPQITLNRNILRDVFNQDGCVQQALIVKLTILSWSEH